MRSVAPQLCFNSVISVLSFTTLMIHIQDATQWTEKMNHYSASVIVIQDANAFFCEDLWNHLVGRKWTLYHCNDNQIRKTHCPYNYQDQFRKCYCQTECERKFQRTKKNFISLLLLNYSAWIRLDQCTF